MSTERQDAENPHLQGRSAEQADNAATPVRPEGHARPGRASRLKALLEQGRMHRLALRRCQPIFPLLSSGGL